MTTHADSGRTTRYERDSSWRQPGGGRVVIAGSPLRLFRLSTGGAQVLALAADGEHPQTDTVQRFLDRFVDAGALHPCPEGGTFTVADVTVVTPAHGEVPPLSSTLATIVVDDGSEPPLQLPPDASPDTVLVRLPFNRGPAAARNAGLAMVTTPLVAFLDADVTPTVDWLQPLLAHFDDPSVALVAPRVAGGPGVDRLARYERRHSPLDLGTEPARVAAGTRVSYVPAAALLCRAESLRELSGFDEAMRVGEDVDLVWRLTEHGVRCRYEPAVVVHHRPRSSWGALLRQRMGYGRSAAALARRHPGALAPVRMSGWSAGVWLLAAVRRPWLAAIVAGGTAVALQRKLRDVPPRESVRLVALGHLAAGRQLAKAITRVWWPVALVVAVLVPRARAVVFVAVVGPAALDIVRARTLESVVDAPMIVAEEMAYATGVWQGVLAAREWGPLRPEFTTWPGRGGG